MYAAVDSPVKLTQLQKSILNIVRTQGTDNFTQEQISREFSGYGESTIRTEIARLVKKGVITPTGLTTRNKNGRQAKLFRLA